METDVIVIGAGPGGSASAISFRRRGFGVAVLEKRFMPRSKVCGEMVAPLGVKELRRLGVLEKIEAAGANKVRKIIFYSPDGAGREIAFPGEEYGVAMSREMLDTVLFKEARGEGALGVEGFRVDKIERESGTRLFRVEGAYSESGKRESFRSNAVINASGLKGIGYRDKKCREFLYAFKIHLRGISCGDSAELFFYDGGYGGLVDIDPFTGLGISLALQGGRYIGENLEVGKERRTYDLKRSLNRTRLLTAGMLRKVLFRPRLCSMIMKHASFSSMLGTGILGILHT